MTGPARTETRHEVTVENWTYTTSDAPAVHSGSETAQASFPEANEGDPYVHQVRAVGRAIGSVCRWIAYLMLLGWTACAPESLAPYLFQGFLIADFATWAIERGMQSFVWRTHRFSLGQLGGDLLAFGIILAIFKVTDGSAGVGHPPGYGATETAVAIFFTGCARTVSIAVRRMHDITLGTGR